MSGQGQKAGVLYWPCDTHPNLETHTHTPSSFPPLILLYWRLFKINKNDLGVHPPFGCIILEVPSLEYSSHTVQWASRAHVICHWFPPSSHSLTDSLAPSHCTQHKKTNFIIMYMHNNPLFSCPLVISLFHYLFHFLSPSSFISFVHSTLCSGPTAELSSQVTVLCHNGLVQMCVFVYVCVCVFSIWFFYYFYFHFFTSLLLLKWMSHMLSTTSKHVYIL